MALLMTEEAAVWPGANILGCLFLGETVTFAATLAANEPEHSGLALVKLQ